MSMVYYAHISSFRLFFSWWNCYDNKIGFRIVEGSLFCVKSCVFFSCVKKCWSTIFFTMEEKTVSQRKMIIMSIIYDMVATWPDKHFIKIFAHAKRHTYVNK